MEKDYRTASGKFWQTVRRLRRGKQLSANTVYGGDGELLVSTGDIVGRWKEYFEDLLNPTDTPSVEEPEAGDSEVDSFITQAEVTEVVQQLLGGKAPGVDEIRPEYLKSLDVVGLSWLTRLCNIAWRSGTVPLDWATGVVVPLFKKGDRRVCSNYRGITLLSLPGKVYSRVLERRVRPLVEPWIQEEQCGFRPSCGTLDQPYTLHRVLEGSWEFAQTVHMCFVDLEKAFDRVPRGILWEVLWEYGVRGPLLRAVRSLYNWSRSLVRIAICKSDLFPVHVGLRQGCPLSPVLFIVFMDRISRHSQGLEGVQFGDHRISSLIFADDVVLLASSGLDLQHALGRFAAECEAAGMKVSTSKSEAMVLDRKKVACTLQVGGEVLPQVEEFKYLGVLFTSEGRMDREIGRRIGAAAAVMRSMYRSVVVKKELSRKAKLSIYQSIYAPTLTYGHELWVMTERPLVSKVLTDLISGRRLTSVSGGCHQSDLLLPPRLRRDSLRLTPHRRRRSPSTPPSLPPLGGFRPSRAEVVTRLDYALGDVARLCCLAVDVARLCCSVVDVARPSCSAVDVTRRFCSALLLSCGRRLGPSGLTAVPIAPPTCLALLLAPSTYLAVFLAPFTCLALLLAPPTCLALLLAPPPCCLSLFLAPLRVLLARKLSRTMKTEMEKIKDKKWIQPEKRVL
ncbi:hypothetical protein QTP86_006752 [Hemibagrus guttatus]|nr:hypothetical protein QTP86_006752 [Hemibagrus guttatus]